MCIVTQMIRSAYVAFAAFGAFWGAWGASVPRVQRQAGLDDGGLGIALLFVGAGALPAMLLTGRLLDRWGLRFSAGVIGALGLTGVGLVLTASGLVSLCVGLAVVGAVSGAADVAMNAVAGRAEKDSGRPVITRAHGVFSSLVVLGSLGTGLVAGTGLPVVVPFAAVAALSVVAAVFLGRHLPAHAGVERLPEAGPPSRRLPFLLLGALGALAFAVENAHQSWSAVFAADVLDSGPGLSAVAPAVFAGTVALTRFSIGGIPDAYARIVLLAGAATAAAGTTVLAAADTPAVATLGLAAAAAGTAVLFPTLIGIASRTVAEAYRGRATSLVTTVSYLGFIVGPVYVGLWSDTVGLRGAMIAVAALAVALVVLTPALLRVARPRTTAHRT